MKTVIIVCMVFGKMTCQYHNLKEGSKIHAPSYETVQWWMNSINAKWEDAAGTL
jgi:hypothetical protein